VDERLLSQGIQAVVVASNEIKHSKYASVTSYWIL
jgi:hypothetical protein